jgi:ABC-type antimicrobial peptide transport system permease subunit
VLQLFLPTAALVTAAVLKTLVSTPHQELSMALAVAAVDVLSLTFITTTTSLLLLEHRARSLSGGATKRNNLWRLILPDQLALQVQLLAYLLKLKMVEMVLPKLV